MVKAEVGIRAQAFRHCRASDFDRPHRKTKKMNEDHKKMLDGHGGFAYVGGCRALVAQLDRATGYEPVGREFESLRAHHIDIWKACRKAGLFVFPVERNMKKTLDVFIKDD